MVLCDRNIAELRDILNRKAPKYLPDAEVLLAEMSTDKIKKFLFFLPIGITFPEIAVKSHKNQS